MTPNIQFLINCCKTEPTGSEIKQIQLHIKELNSQQLSEMVTLSHAHGIFPLVYHAIQAHAANLLSEQSLAELKQHNMNIVMQNMKMTAELIHIMNLLEENGIEAISFKGPILSQLAYGDITKRQYGDLDILVSEKQLYQVAQLIVAQDYQPMDSIEFLKNEAKLHVEKNYEFYGRKNGVKVEVHWRLINTSFLKKFKNYNIWENAQEVSINNIPIPTLDTKILLLYLCNHGASHMWERIEWIADIDRLVRSTQNTLDWDDIVSSSITLQSNTTLLLGLGLANKLFDTMLPPEIEALLKQDPVISKLVETILGALNSDLLFQDHTSTHKNYEIFLFNLAPQDTFSTKLRFLLQTLFGYSDRDVMVINLPRSLFFLYYPIRIGRILKKYVINLITR